ncbi:MAG: hypothetical protein Q9181_007364 [Wetmoreana brouardii]
MEQTCDAEWETKEERCRDVSSANPPFATFAPTHCAPIPDGKPLGERIEWDVASRTFGIMATMAARIPLPFSTRFLQTQPLTRIASRNSCCQIRYQSSSTSALAYKALHRRITPLPTADAPSWSAPAAVSSILYETPLPSTLPPKRHILNCLVQNEPGVLSRVSGILAARGFNIDSLVVCNTEVEDLSRMTIVLSGQDGVVEQARRQLEDLVPVWAVLDYSAAPLVQRELLLAKVSILGPEYFEEIQSHHREMTASDPSQTGNNQDPGAADWEGVRQTQEEPKGDYHPSRLAASQALRHKHEHLEAITYLTHQFGGKVLDISTGNCIVEVSAKPTRIDSFMKLLSPFGILESARTGLMALPRSPLYGSKEEIEKEASDLVDASSLPPG